MKKHNKDKDKHFFIQIKEKKEISFIWDNINKFYSLKYLFNNNLFEKDNIKAYTNKRKDKKEVHIIKKEIKADVDSDRFKIIGD